MTEKTNKSSFGEKLKRIFLHNWWLKLASLLFAIVLWGYVLTSQNPTRIKLVPNVSVWFDGETDLSAKNLVVRGDTAKILEPISARVETELTKFADFDANSITATVSLKSISTPGTYTLPIMVTAKDGTILSTSRKNITVEIDRLQKRSIPVQVVQSGTLPDGYWADEPAISVGEIEIEGALTDVNMVSRAVCEVNLDGRTESYYDSVSVKLLDENNEEIDPALFRGQFPSVTLRLMVLPTKKVPVNVEKAAAGADQIRDGYEIKGYTITPKTVLIAAPQDVLDGISELDVEMFDVAGESESMILENHKIIVPDGVRLISAQTVDIYVNITEIQETLSIDSIPIKIEGLGRSYTAELEIESSGVSLLGGRSIINKLTRKDITLYIDVTDLEVGVYTLDVHLRLPKDEYLDELTVTVGVPKVTVSIKKR